MTQTYIRRPIANAILSDHHKVVIVEGARAVGKTMLAKNELVQHGFAYYTLADTNTYNYASSNPTSWFNSLSDRAIIDEAQRVKELPLLIKEAVDNSTSQGPQYILTGSASIGRSSLDGQDALVRRAGRFTVSPLTQREARGIHASIIDDLWHGEINESFQSSSSRSEIARLMSIGGFPQYVTNASIISQNERSLSIRADIASILGTTVVPTERLDSTIADSVLQYLLALPSSILNVNNLAKMTGLNTRTVTSYISVLVSRFLIRPLKNQKLSAAKQEFTRAKMHPVDPSFSIEAFMRAGRDIMSDPTLFGYAFESFVASQLLPSIEWSTVHPEAFFWREAGNSPKEVDFVLTHNNESLGIEVKSSDTVDHNDFKSLQALCNQQNLIRGFVVYTGKSVVREAENMWALPIDALWNEDAFSNTSPTETNIRASARTLIKITSDTPVRNESNMQSAANLFLSYNHADNEHLENGIIRFVEKVKEEYEFSYGETLSLFIDTQSIQWGDDWRKALSRGIEATNFIMPAVTPRYVLSSSCRDELFKFCERIKGNSHSHILPMIWQPIDAMTLDSVSEKARGIIQNQQYLQLSNLRDLPETDVEYKKMVRMTTTKLREVIESHGPNGVTVNSAIPDSTTDDERGLLEQLDEANAGIAILQTSITRAVTDIDTIAEALNNYPAPSSAKPGVFSAWGTEIAKATQNDVAQLNDDLDNIEKAWASVYEFIAAYMNIEPLIDADRAGATRASLLQLRTQLTLPSEIDLLANQLNMLQGLSPKLRPMARALGRFIDIVRSIVQSIDELTDRG